MLVVAVAAGCSGSPPRVAVGSTEVPTVAPGKAFDVVVNQNASIGDKYEVTSVDGGTYTGFSYGDGDSSTGGGSEVLFHITAGDAPGPGKVTIRYCYRGCGGADEDGKPDRDEVVPFTVG